MLPCSVFSESTANAFTKEQILNFEKQILETLNWNIELGSFASWSNDVTHQWDYFMDNLNIYISDLPYSQMNFNKPRFRSKNATSYNKFRAFFYYIDLLTLDSNYLEYSEKLLTLALLYIFMSNILGNLDFSKLKIKHHFSEEDISNNFDFNILFGRFTDAYYYIDIELLKEHIIYISFFIDSNFNIKPPKLNEAYINDGEKNVI